MEEVSDEGSYEPDIKRFYRAFSFELEARMSPDAPSDQLARIVVEDRKREDSRNQELAELREQFEPLKSMDDPEIRKLDVERQKLDDAWTQFRNILPPDARNDLAKRPVTFEDVVNVMKGVETEWQQKKDKGSWGNTKKYLRLVSGTISSHSTLLKILPADSQYASIFCGTLLTLVKASANYEKIAAGLTRALSEITEAVAVCVKECALYATKASIGSIATLYTHIFCFLRNAIGWYTKRSSRRLLSSFQEDFYEKFEEQIGNIKQVSSSIHREAQHASHTEIRYLRLRFAKFEESMGIGLLGLEREAAERRERELRLAEENAKELKKLRLLLTEPSSLLHLVAHRTGASLQEQGSALLHDLDARDKEEEAIRSPQTSLVNSPSLVRRNKAPGKDEILLLSRHLEDRIDHDRIMIGHDESYATYTDWQIVSALEEWTTSKSQILCIIGPNPVTDTSLTTVVAIKYLASANQASIPTISYNCELPRTRTTLPKDTSAEMSGLVSLTYALIRQLIELLPSFMDYTEDLGAQRFARFDGSAESYYDAITLLGDLLDLSPPMLFCVIDGFEVLDDRSITAHLTAFVKILRGHKTYRGPLSQGAGRVLKVLFTTAGRSRCLLTELDDKELVFAERAGSALKPGKPLVGRRSLSPTPLKKLKDDASV